MSDRPSWMIQSLERMALILDLFTVERPSWSEQEIAVATGLSRGTVYRFCQTLRHLGYLDADAHGIRPGIRAVTLGQAALRSLDIAELARPALARLREATDGTVNLAVPDGDDMVFLARLRGGGLLDIRLQVGSRVPSYCTSLGRAVLACLSEDELNEYLRRVRLEPRTGLTVTEPSRLKALIDRVRVEGYAVNDGELEVSLRGVAAAVRHPDGSPAAAVNVAITRPFGDNEVESRLAPLVMATAAEIGALMAGNGRMQDDVLAR